MSDVVYVLCGVTAALCAFLLLRAYLSAKVRLMFWAGLTFVGLTLNNAALILDYIVLPDTDLRLVRAILALVALLPLLFGLIWES